MLSGGYFYLFTPYILLPPSTTGTHVEKHRLLMRRREENLVAYRASTPRAGHYVCPDVLLFLAVRCGLRGDSFPAVWCARY